MERASEKEAIAFCDELRVADHKTDTPLEPFGKKNNGQAEKTWRRKSETYTVKS